MIPNRTGTQHVTSKVDREAEEIAVLFTKLGHQVWWHTSSTGGGGDQRQVDICELKAGLVYKTSFQPVRDIQ